MNSTEIKNLLLHLRIPFSFFLLPVFLFTVSEIPKDYVDWMGVGILWCILHILVYPSSNGYNSYMDQDETSIGGLKFPPKVPKTMFFITVVLDIVALISTYYYFGKKPMLLLFVYILASRAYSYRGIRLKKYPIIGYLTVCICQGILIYFLVNLSCNTLKDNNHVLNAIISFLLVGAGYPLSQVYQHESDKKDNVETISMKLGIRGTFIFSGVLFFTLFVCFVLKFLLLQYTAAKFFSFILCLFPVLLLFTQWSIAVFKDDKNANYDGTMKMNTAGAISMNLYFIFLIII